MISEKGIRDAVALHPFSREYVVRFDGEWTRITEKLKGSGVNLNMPLVPAHRENRPSRAVL